MHTYTDLDSMDMNNNTTADQRLLRYVVNKKSVCMC